MSRERALVLFLRAYATMLLCAAPATIIPTSWLAASYTWIGLGASWPEVPLLEYLARSASGLYALVGAMVLLMSFDPPRYRAVLRLLAWVSLPGAIYLTLLDSFLQLPLWWIAAEGSMVLASGIVILWLTRASPTPCVAPSDARSSTSG